MVLWLRWPGLLLGFVGIGLFAWGIWPPRVTSRVLVFEADEMMPAVQEKSLGSARQNELITDRDELSIPASLTARRLRLIFPERVRMGDAAVIRLTFEPLFVTDETQEVVSPPRNILAEARLEMGGARIEPHSMMTQGLLHGETVGFEWQVMPERPGEYIGTAWFALYYLPQEDDGESARRVLAAQELRFRSEGLIGMPGITVRWIGGVMAVTGCLLMLGSKQTSTFQRRLKV